MPWQERSVEQERAAFAVRANQADVNMRALCREYGISPKTGYLWRERYREQGAAGVANQSRRPHHSPTRTPAEVEAAVVAVRRAHPAWGGRKIAAWLVAQGVDDVPSASTITAILRRHGVLAAVAPRREYQRWERAQPNELWQMDFKGDFATATGRCYPLTLLDDHSRFALCLAACADQRGDTVQARVTRVFGEYGLPQAVLCDHGAPWGSGMGQYTAFAVWLLRLGVQVLHGRPRHPQTQGKEERFHRTLTAEVLTGQTWSGRAACQQAFDAWRVVYNTERPHEAVGLQPPATRYRASPTPLPAALPPVAYDVGVVVRRVRDGGRIRYGGQQWRVGRAFDGLDVAVTPSNVDGVCHVHFLTHQIAQIDLRDPAGNATSVEEVSAQV